MQNNHPETLTQELMDHVRLWRVHRLTLVPHVLSAVKRFKCKPVEKVPGVHQSRHRPDVPTRLCMDDVMHILRAWQSIGIAL